ncbi:MAG: hypothetical protein H0T46_06975 [Deltaproteobacteria bacterium]|nr:hypothetical protein [Deltaproteobacteria bacterium]
MVTFDRTVGGQLHVTLEVEFRGPPRRDGEKTLNAPEARHWLRFVATGDKVEVARDALDDATLRPEWDDVKLVFEDSKVYVEPAAL